MIAAYLRRTQGDNIYRSATGRFDLYVLFIEKGIRLLSAAGRMAYIAPNRWPISKYGKGLIGLISEGRQLERWTDFRSHQIFDEATTYTALQVFTKDANDAVLMALAPGGEGDAADIDWSDPDLAVPYDALPADSEWLIATGAERRLIDRLARDCVRLDDPSLTDGIIVGVQATLNYVYHLDRVSDGTYRCHPKDGNPKAGVPHSPSYIVEIEDEIMRPLISGDEAKRYENPETSTYLLFPYAIDDKGRTQPFSSEVLKKRFPNAWAHLSKWRDRLNLNDETGVWWRYTYPKNLGIQHRPKLIVGQTVPCMRVSADTEGRYYLDNVRVNGILAQDEMRLGHVLGALNGAVADFVFRRLGKPKRGGYFEANKQYIEPLPIPRVDDKDCADVARRARDLQDRWTNRRDLDRAAEDRLGTLVRARHDARWLWPNELPSHADLVDQAPRALAARGDRIAWAHQRFEALEAVEIARLQAALEGGSRLTAAFADGELRLFVGGAVILGRIYLDDGPGRMAEAYWRWLLLSQSWRDAKSFAAKLRLPPTEAETPPARQFVERVQALAEETAAIEAAEAEMNALLYRLYDLSEDERELVENERLRRDGR